MENLEINKHLLYAVRIILERKAIDNIWETHKWIVNDLIPLNVSNGSGYPPINDVRIYPLINDIQIEDSNNNLYVAEASIDLHRAEAEGYAENLQSSDPSIYIVLRDGDLLEKADKVDDNPIQNNIDIHLAEVSLSPYHIQDYEDCGEDKVEKIPLYGPIAELLEKFVEFHFHPEAFKKRKRDKKNIDEITRRGGDSRLNKKNIFN